MLIKAGCFLRECPRFRHYYRVKHIGSERLSHKNNYIVVVMVGPLVNRIQRIFQINFSEFHIERGLLWLLKSQRFSESAERNRHIKWKCPRYRKNRPVVIEGT